MKTFKNGALLTIVFMLICGLGYPFLVTGIGQLFFHKQANGSIVTYNGKEAGSSLLGQQFSSDKFFRGRVSSVSYNTYKPEDTKPDKSGKIAYSGVGSGSQNLGPSNKALSDRVKSDINDFLKSHPGVKKQDIPADLLTSSGSGLDPDISPEAANIQIPAVSKASGISEAKLSELVKEHTAGRTLGILGEPRVNVLLVNLEIANILKGNGKL